MPAPSAAIGLETEAGLAVGRDPREMTRAELESLGHGKQPLRKVIRARCLDCCCEQPSEVRKCTATRCANWPYRMGSDPWRAEPSEARREAGRRLGARRAAGVENPGSSRELHGDSPPPDRLVPDDLAVAEGGGDAATPTA